MPGQRAADQRLIAFALKDEFVRALDAARHKIGETRSIFVRKALIEAVRARGIPADDAWALAPDRAGKPRPRPAGRELYAGPSPVISEGAAVNSPEAALAILNDHLAASGTATPAAPGPAGPGASSYRPRANKGRGGRGRKGTSAA